MTIETHNWSSSAHQELRKIVREEIFPIVNQVDARHKALELKIERLLKAVVSQDIMIIMQNKSVVDTADLQTELERWAYSSSSHATNDMDRNGDRLRPHDTEPATPQSLLKMGSRLPQTLELQTCIFFYIIRFQRAKPLIVDPGLLKEEVANEKARTQAEVEKENTAQELKDSNEKVVSLEKQLNMENVIEDLKSKVTQAEGQTDSVEDKCIILSEANDDLKKELSFVKGRFKCLETSLHQMEEAKKATAKDISIRSKFITDLVMQMAHQIERLQKHIASLKHENKILVKSLRKRDEGHAEILSHGDEASSDFSTDNKEAISSNSEIVTKFVSSLNPVFLVVLVNKQDYLRVAASRYFFRFVASKCGFLTRFCYQPASSTHDQDVFSFYLYERFCDGLEEVLRRYKEIVPHLKLAGIISFSLVIEHAMTIVEQSGGHYHALLIIVDGHVALNSFVIL
nr:WPP domain-interacting tail-anchored protein 1 [Tanacetum cinerariifolium]